MIDFVDFSDDELSNMSRLRRLAHQGASQVGGPGVGDNGGETKRHTSVGYHVTADGRQQMAIFSGEK